MKKFLALLLAVALLVGMTTFSFAEKKLYLAYNQLEVEDDEEPAPDPEVEPEPEAPAPEPNTNYNPGTGC